MPEPTTDTQKSNAPESLAIVSTDGRPTIELPGNNRLLSDFATELGKVVSGKDFFSRGGMPFVVNEERTGLKLVTPDFFRTWSEQYLVCYKSLRSGDGRPAFQPRHTMTIADASGALCSPQFLNQLKPIKRINPIPMPVIDRTGGLKLLAPGYDSSTQTFTLNSNVQINTNFPAKGAKLIIDQLLSEFSFGDKGRSRAVVVSAMLTMFARGILPTDSLRPCFVFLANAEGAGKTLLAKIATVPVLGFSPVCSIAKDEDEMRKLLLSSVMEGKQVIFFDNIKGTLSSQSLEGFLTSQNYTGRILGDSRTFTGENNVTVFVTGNGCTVSPDMRRRSVFCELFMDAERAEDRVFQFMLEVPQLISSRSEILTTLYSLVRDWCDRGKPPPARENSSFPEWSRIIGGIVELAGYGCPVETPQIKAAVDVDGENMRALVNVLGEGSFPFVEVIANAQKNNLFTDILPEIGQVDNSRRTTLAKLIRRYDGRRIGDYRLSLEGIGHKRVYRLVSETANDGEAR